MSPLNTSPQDLRESWKPENGKIVKYRVDWGHRRKVSSKHRRSDAYINSLILKQHVQGLKRFGGSKLITPSITYVASTIDKSSQIKKNTFLQKKKSHWGYKTFSRVVPMPSNGWQTQYLNSMEFLDTLCPMRFCQGIYFWLCIFTVSFCM